ncbi:gustatory receptor for sugar taste 43a [Anopheles aquasalis]|uniref:gustatory receptor for sugar taste 43a n=1 Tax=Anopheles aquasalis TaxID=42839 RepID=UPI00215AAC59|nr:gustatory receptor for sugar taste 43a [Anopheles aquasalis]
MEISEPTKVIFYMSRLFGLAPYRIKRTSKGQIVDFRRNIFLVLYSLFLVFCLAGLTYKGIFFDVTSKKPIRMKTATSKVVTILDVSVVVSACICGTLSGLLGHRFVLELNQRLTEIDDILDLYKKNPICSREKQKGIVMLSLVSFIIIGALSLDIWVWYRIADKIKNEYNDSSTNVLGYIPFYCLYFILMMFHVQFAQAALGIASRYRELNIILLEMISEFDRTTQAEVSQISIINRNLRETVSTIDYSTETGVKNVLHGFHKHRKYAACRIITDLATIHASLSYAIVLVSKTFGIALLAVLGSCLLHLVATSYFLMVELVGDKDAVFAWIQALWLFIHMFRFLLTIEPCHITNAESQRTIIIINSLRRLYNEPDVAESINIFWQQLVGTSFSFSACGLCTIDRHIITSYCGAIATYLVILIQFKEADDHVTISGKAAI